MEAKFGIPCLEKRKEGEIEIEKRLVSIKKYGLEGSNYYYRTRANGRLTEEQVFLAGATKEVFVDRDVAKVLKTINKKLKKTGYCLYIKEGYRSEALYELIYEADIKKMLESGEASTRELAKELSLINNINKPHSKGRTVDVVILKLNPKTGDVYRDLETNEPAEDPDRPRALMGQVFMRNGEDGRDAAIVDFYKNKNDPISQRYQRRQEALINLMKDHDFCLGTKREYWHFEYKPETY